MVAWEKVTLNWRVFEDGGINWESECNSDGSGIQAGCESCGLPMEVVQGDDGEYVVRAPEAVPATAKQG